MTTKLRAASFQDGAVTTAKIAADAITNVKIADDAVQIENVASTVNLGRRNIIINGAMQVAQRGTSFTSQTADHYFVDRFKLGATSLGTWTTSQSTDSPNGFAYSAKIECTTADASPAATDILYFYTRFEGQNLQHLKFGTSDAESITISFYVKCSKTGVFTVNWRNQDAGRSIGSDVTINSADTWEFKTITFAGDTSGAFTNDNGWSANLEFMLNGGSNYTSGSTLTSYASHSNTNGTRSGGTTLALGANTGETIQFTGIQVEVGSQATPFEHLSYGETLALAQRYCFDINPPTGASPNTPYIMSCAVYNNTIAISHVRFPTEMRATPTTTLTGAAADFSIVEGNQIRVCTAFSANGLSSAGGGMNWVVNSGGMTTANAGNVYIESNKRGFFDAEL